MSALTDVLRDIPYPQILLILGTVVIGYLVAKTVASLIRRQVERRMDSTSGMLAQKVAYYGVLVLLVLVVLREMDISLGTLIAAGGLFGVALGFASQTAVSNIISGIFLIFERPFNVSDVIKVDGNVGFVESIDLLSTKVRTLDNQYWRMPNEKLLKNDIVTITRYEIRRMDVVTSVSYEDDLQAAREALLDCAEDNPLVMGDPEPQVIVNNMGESGIELILRLWFHRPDFIELKSEITRQAKVRLEAAGCTIPFPHRTVYLRNEDDWEAQHHLESKSTPSSDTSL